MHARRQEDAHAVAEAVAHALEVVDVHDQHGDRARVRGNVTNRVVERGPVEQTRERVVLCLVRGQLALADPKARPPRQVDQQNGKAIAGFHCISHQRNRREYKKTHDHADNGYCHD